jgi:PAS domain S-box-containing protein
MRTTFKLSLIMFIMLSGFTSFLLIYELYRRDDLKLLHESILKNDDMLFTHILQLNREKIGNPLRDYATWDDMLNYTAEPGNWFEQQSLENTLKTFSLNHLWVFNRDGKPVFSQKDSLYPDLKFPVSREEMTRLMTPVTPFLHSFFMIDGKVFELFGSTVTTSADQAHKLTPGGFLFFGKVWDERHIRELADISGLTVRMVSGDSLDILVKSPNKLLYPLNGPEGEHVATLEVGHLSLLESNADRNYLINLLILFAVGLIGNAAIGVLLRFWIARPLNRIMSSLNSDSEEPISKLKGRKNEFGQIADLISNSLSLKKELKRQSDSRELLLKRFTLAARSAYFGIFEWEVETNKFMADEFVCELFEVDSATTSNVYPEMLKRVHPDDVERVRQEFLRAADGFGELQTEYRLLFDGGRQKTLQISGLLIRGEHDRIRILTGICRDVTLEKQSMEMIRASEEKFRQIAESSSDFIWEVDAKGFYTYCSDRIYDILGYTADEVVGKKYFYDFFDPESRELIKTAAFEGFAQKATITQFVNKCQHKNGHFVILETNGVPNLASDGSLLGYRGTDRDITVKQKVESELRISKEKAEISSRLKSSLLNNMSHELRTPLNGILGFAALLRDRLTGDDQGMIEIIQHSGKRLMLTLNSIMELAEIEADQTQLHPELTDLGALATRYLGKNGQLFEKKELNMLQTIDRGVFARIDPRLFESIMFHLLDNAVKYTDSGSVSVEIRAEKDALSEYAVLKVRDTGIGISEQQMEFIFEAFRQGNEGLSRSHEGAGLGLTLCRSFTQLMGGNISADSTVGAGSTFTVRFPLVIAPPEQAIDPDTEAAELQLAELPVFEHKPRILIVEDNEANSELMAIFLKDVCVTDQVYSGAHAVKMAYLNDYSLILMDINLGQGLDGIRAMQEIRKIWRYSGIPFIAVTGYTTEAEKRQIMSHGFAHFLAKPFDRSGLVHMVVSLLKA